MTLIDISMVETGLHELIILLGVFAFVGIVVTGAIWLSDGDEGASDIFLLLCLSSIILFTTYNSIDRHEVHSYIVEDYEELYEKLKDYSIYSQPENGYYRLIKNRE